MISNIFFEINKQLILHIYICIIFVVFFIVVVIVVVVFRGGLFPVCPKFHLMTPALGHLTPVWSMEPVLEIVSAPHQQYEEHHLHRIKLYCTTLFCIVTHCTTLYCTELYNTLLHYFTMQCTLLHCTTLHCTATLSCTVISYSTLNVLQATVRSGILTSV